jgi:two-component sensor histidine kinase
VATAIDELKEEINLDNAETLGMRLIKALVEQLEGTVELKKSPHPEFTIRIPIEAALL